MTDLYPKLLDKLFNINKHGSAKFGLQNIQKLNELFGNPDRKFKSVHIAGTNGKGSVTVKIGKALELAGYRTGVFTSPHISTYRERIQINGSFISEEDLVFHLEKIFAMIDKHSIPATFFEISTMLAINYFASKEIEWGVFETGLGGRLDATNILSPELSVITSISKDHEDILGDTLEKIAFEKAGIIKAGIPVVLGPRTPFIPRIQPVHEVKGNFATTELENREIAKRAIEVLKIPFYPQSLEAKLPCRMDRFLVDGVDVILDVAHNADGLTQLFKALDSIPVRIVFGLSKTKDLTTCTAIIKEKTKNIHIIDVPEKRGYSKEELERAFFPIAVKSSSSIQKGIVEAIECAKTTGETVLVCGSCYIMNDALQRVS